MRNEPSWPVAPVTRADFAIARRTRLPLFIVSAQHAREFCETYLSALTRPFMFSKTRVSTNREAPAMSSSSDALGAEIVALPPECGFHLCQENGNVELSGAVDARIPHGLQARIVQGRDARCKCVRGRREEENGLSVDDRFAMTAFIRRENALPRGPPLDEGHAEVLVPGRPNDHS